MMENENRDPPQKAGFFVDSAGRSNYTRRIEQKPNILGDFWAILGKKQKILAFFGFFSENVLKTY